MDWIGLVLAVLGFLTAIFQWLKARRTGIVASAATEGIEAVKRVLVNDGKADVAARVMETIGQVAKATGAEEKVKAYLAKKGLNAESVVAPALKLLGGLGGPPGRSGPR